MDNSTYELLSQDVKTAARTTGREWADVLDADDAEQEIWARLLDAGTNVWTEIAGMEKPARISVLNEIGHQIGMRYRDEYELFSGNYVYGTKEVRKLLDGGNFLSLPDRSDTLTLSERTDLISALERLRKRNAHYVDILIKQFVEHDPIHTHSQELTRAVDALTHEMNRVNRARQGEFVEGPGSRKAIA